MEASISSSSSEATLATERNNRASCVKAKKALIITSCILVVVGVITGVAVYISLRNTSSVPEGDGMGDQDVGEDTDINKIISAVSAPMRTYTEAQYTSYIAQRKGLYIWSSTSLKKVDGVDGWRVIYRKTGDITHLARFCVRHGIDVVLLYTGCIEWEHETYFKHGSLPEPEGLGLIVDVLAEFSVGVELLTYVNDDINTFDGYEKIQDLVDAVGAFNEGRKHKVIGIHIDQEPNNPTVYSSLLQMLTLAKTGADKYGLEVNLALKPLWLTQPHPATSTTPFASTILSATGGMGTIMAYSSNPSKVVGYSATFSSLVPAYLQGSAGVHAAIETGVLGAAENETLGAQVKKGAEWFSTASSIFDGLDSNGMAAVVIHDYTQYHTGLYGVDPHSSDIRVLDALWKDEGV